MRDDQEADHGRPPSPCAKPRERQKYTDTLREVLRETPATALVRCLRDASLAEQAAMLASYARQAHEMELERLAADDPDYDPGPSADQFGLTFDERLFESVFAALAAAATRPVPAELLAAAADVPESFYVGYAADVIRGQELGPVPVALETMVAQLACAAAGALAGAAEASRGGDAEWNACMTLRDNARDLTRQAAAAVN